MYHRYYQWVPFAFAVVAGLFYVPKLLWKQCEGGMMHTICEEIDDKGKSMKMMTYDDAKTTKRIQHILRLYMKGNWHFRYAAALCACEALNFAVVVIVWTQTDYFLNGTFSSYGSDFYTHFHALITDGTNAPGGTDGTNPMESVFPKVTKCTFHTFGFSGTQQKVDGLCVLMLNIINEKVYYFLWFWYIVLGVISIGMIIRRSLMVFFAVFFPECMG